MKKQWYHITFDSIGIKDEEGQFKIRAFYDVADIKAGYYFPITYPKKPWNKNFTFWTIG